MTPEKILELAAENETGTFSERVWAFDEEALIAFAQSVIEAERESSDEPVLWVEIDDEGNLAWDADKMISDDRGGLDNPIPLYRHPPPARKLTDEEIDDVIQSQCWAYGFDANAYPFARAIERRINGDNS